MANKQPTQLTEDFSQQLSINVDSADTPPELDTSTDTVLSVLETKSAETTVKSDGTETTITSSSSSSVIHNSYDDQQRSVTLEKDSEGRIAAYVDFNEIIDAVEKAKESGLVPKDYEL